MSVRVLTLEDLVSNLASPPPRSSCDTEPCSNSTNLSAFENLPDDILLLILHSSVAVSVGTCTSLASASPRLLCLYKEYKCTITVPAIFKSLNRFLPGAILILRLLSVKTMFKKNGYIPLNLVEWLIHHTHKVPPFSLSHIYTIKLTLSGTLCSQLQAEIQILQFRMPKKASLWRSHERHYTIA